MEGEGTQGKKRPATMAESRGYDYMPCKQSHDDLSERCDLSLMVRIIIITLVLHKLVKIINQMPPK